MKGNAITMLSGLVALLMLSAVSADTTLTLRGLNDGKRGLIQVSKGVARISDVGDSGYLLYEQARDRIIDVEPQGGVYTAIDKAVLQQVATQMVGMQDMMAAQMRSLSAEQRAMMEAQMGGMMGMPTAGAGMPQTVRSESRGSRQVAGVNCQSYALFDGTRPMAEVCLAAAGNSAISAEDMATLLAMMDFMRSMTQAMPTMGEPIDPLMLSDLRGVALEVKGAVNGDNFTLESVSQGRLDSALFLSYKNLRQQSLMEAGMDHDTGMNEGMPDMMELQGMPGMPDPMMNMPQH